MPYSIRLPDGRVVGNIPDDVDPYDAKQQIDKAYPELTKGVPRAELADVRPEDVGIFEGAGAALKRGFESFGDIAAGYGLTGAKLFGTKEEAAEKMAEIKKEQAIAPETPMMTVADFERIAAEKGVLEAAKEAPKYILEQLGLSGPQMAGPLAAGAIGTAVGSPLLGIVAGTGVYGLQQFGNFLVRQAVAKEDPEELEIAKAALTAAGTAPLGFMADRLLLGLGSIGKKAGEQAVKELTAREIALRTGKRTAEGAAIGILAEAPTEVLEQIAERWQAGLSLTDEEAYQEYKEALFGAAAVGGTIGGAARGYGGYREAKAARAEAPPEVTTEPRQVASNTYDVIDIEGNPSKVTVTENELGEIIARDETGEEADLTNIVSRGVSVEDAVKRAFSFEEAPEPAPASPIEPPRPAAPELITPQMPDIPPRQVPTSYLPDREPVPPEPPKLLGYTPTSGAAAIAGVSNQNPMYVFSDGSVAIGEEAAFNRRYEPQKLSPEELSAIEPDLEGVEFRPVEQPPLPLTPEEEAELAERPKREKELNARVKELEDRYRALTSRAGKGESLREAVQNRLTNSEVVDIGTEPYFRKNFGVKKGQKGLTISDLIADHTLDQWLPEDLIIVDNIDSPDTVLDKEIRGAEHIKDKLRNRDYRTTAAEMEARSIEEELRQILEDIEREAGRENLRDIVAEIYEDEIAKGFEPGEFEYAATGVAEPTGTTRIERAAQSGKIKYDPSRFEIRRKSAYRGKTTADVDYELYRDGQFLQAFSRKKDAQQMLDVYTLTDEEIYAKYPELKPSEADLAARKRLEEKVIADRERELFALQPQVAERVGAPTGDLFGAEGIQQIQPAAPKARSVPSGQLNLFNSDKDFVDNAITERIQKSVGKPVNMEEAKRVENALKKKDPLQAAKWLAANATRSDFQMIAKRIADRMQKLMDAGIKFKLHVAHVGNRVPSRLLSSNGITVTAVNQSTKKLASVDVWLNGTDVTGRIGTDEETVIHELIHAVTSGANYLGTFKSMQGTEAAKLATRLNDLRNAVVKHFNQRVTSMPTEQLTAIEKRVFVNGANALEDGDEVLAWGLTDPDMQAYLESIPYKGKTAWNAFVDAIREFLGLPKAKETALSEVLAISDLLFEAPLVEAGQAQAAPAAKPAAPIPTSDQIQLFNARVAGMNNDQKGKTALDIVNTLGRGLEPPKTRTDKLKEALLDDRGNLKITPETAKKEAVKWMDKVETWVFSSDAALDNAIRRTINDTTKSQQEKIGALLKVSSSQAVHADAVASLFMRYGAIEYNPETYKYEAVDKKDNLISLVKDIDNLAKTYNMTKEQAERVAHTAFEAKRLRSLQEFNDDLDAEIDDLRSRIKQAKRDGDLKAARIMTSEVRRKTKDFKFIHMTEDEIEAGLRLIDLMPKEMNKIIDNWNNTRLNAGIELVRSGLWSVAEAEVLLSNMDYVPFYREDQLEQGKGPKEFLRSLQVQAKEKKLKGSKLAVNDVFDNMARWTQYSVKRSVMNRLAVAKIDAAVEAGLAKKVDEARKTRESVRVWRNGEAEFYNLDDPMFMEAFAGLEPISIPTWKIAAKFSNFLRQSVVLNPLFSLSQVPQDAIAAIYTSGLKPRYALSIPARAVKEFVKTLVGASKTHKDLERVAAVGIKDFTAAIARNDAEVVAGLRSKPGVWNKVKGVLEHISMASDNAVRQAVYEAAIAQGVSRAEALEKSFQLINFKNRGSSKAIALAGQVVPFFNAYLAAQHVALKVLSGRGISPVDRKEALKTLIYTTAAVQALSLVYSMMMDDDEEYKNTPSIIRDRLIMIPGVKMSIPIRPDIFSIPKILTEHTYMLLTNQGSEDGRKFRDSMKAAAGNALFGPTPVPQVVKPIAEVAMNYSFFQGRPLIGTYQKGLETERQFNDSTSELAKVLGSTGAISPIAADHLIRGMFGSVGGLTLVMSNQLIHNDPDVPRPEMTVREALAAIPGTSGFIRREYETGIKNDFYVLRDEVSKAVNTLNDMKARSPHEIEEFLADEKNINRIGMQKATNKITENLSKIRREISRITQSRDMTAKEKQQAIKELREIEQEMLSGVDIKELRRIADL